MRAAAIAKRLDKVMGNNEWISQIFTKVEHLNRSCSDHSPFLISLSSIISQGASIRIINAWSTHYQFMDLIKKVRDATIDGRPMVTFANKLKAVKKKLRACNKKVFGQIGQRVKQAEDKVF